jgi:hypothetical protein
MVFSHSNTTGKSVLVIYAFIYIRSFVCSVPLQSEFLFHEKLFRKIFYMKKLMVKLKRMLKISYIFLTTICWAFKY